MSYGRQRTSYINACRTTSMSDFRYYTLYEQAPSPTYRESDIRLDLAVFKRRVRQLYCILKHH